MFDRRQFLTSAGTLALLPVLGGCGSPAAARPLPSVTGPISGGKTGRPFGAFLGDLAAAGYVEEEFFLEGAAERYEPKGPLGKDGKWTVAAAGKVPYRTRILVRRPREAGRFNGTVLLEWNNVTVGFELTTVGTRNPGIYDDGFAYAAISCQRVGIHGFAKDPQGLLNWDPERYGGLSIPEESICYDIFTQAARVLGPHRDLGERDPLGGLPVSRVVGTGASQSAVRLRGYINAIQPLQKAFHGFVPLLDFGSAMGFDNFVYDYTNLAPEEQGRLFENKTRIRDDLDVPVMVVNTQSEASSYFECRQPDSDRFRFWEIAGASHDPAPSLLLLKRLWTRDGMKLQIPESKASEVEWRPTADIAFTHMHRWLADRTLPPVQPPIEIGADGKIGLDSVGNAKGGIRLPELEVPRATYRFKADELDLEGLTVPFGPEQIKALYPDAAGYVRKVEAAAEHARAAGVIPEWRRREYAESAKQLGAAGQG